MNKKFKVGDKVKYLPNERYFGIITCIVDGGYCYSMSDGMVYYAAELYLRLFINKPEYLNEI